MENIVAKIKELVSASNQLMIKDDKGNFHSLKAGKKGEIVEIDNKEELYKLLWGKKRVSVDDVKELGEVVELVTQYVKENSSYGIKKKLEKGL